MAQDETKPTGPDLSQGIPLGQLGDGKMLVGHVGGEDVLLVRRRHHVFAVGAHCTHYHGPLADGLVVGDTVRCPWHHACFDLRTGEALEAPALSPIACWAVEQHDGKISVREKREAPKSRPRGKAAGSTPEKIVIVGGGAAGFAAAEMLRRENYQDSIVMLSSDDALPYDRPNLSKDYLAGSALIEGHRVFTQLAVLDNLLLAAYDLPRGERAARVEEVLGLFPEIAAKRHERAVTLSGGQQQILAVAQGLVRRPRLLMLDEPSAGASPVLVDRVLVVVRRLREAGIAVLLVEQLIEKALALADRVYALARGSIVLKARTGETDLPLYR
jgi:nitrite reductase/ring-hydroxylating ferredoxin subunit/ABC-type polar amino acid transport system ATPase subunit